MTEQDKQKLQGIQVLRGLAACYVFLFHLWPYAGQSEYMSRSIAGIASWGLSGVDVFFVVSGCVMWHTTRTSCGWAAQRRFIMRRFSRIYLGYWPFLALALILYSWGMPAVIEKKNLAGSLLLTETSMFKLVIGVSWSLVYELYFYLLFSVLLLIGVVARRVIVLLAFLLLVASNLLLYVCGPGAMLSNGFGAWGFFMSPLVAEFLAGAILGAWINSGFGKRQFTVNLFGGLLMLSIGVWLAGHEPDIKLVEILRFLSLGIAASGLVLIVLAIECAQKIKWPAMLCRLGDQSFAIYLGHALAIDLAAVLGLLDAKTMTGPFAAPAIALLFFSVLLFSRYHYRYIERPLYQAFCEIVDKRKIIPPSLPASGTI